MKDGFKTHDDWQYSYIENKYYLYRNMKYQTSMFDNNQIDVKIKQLRRALSIIK